MRAGAVTPATPLRREMKRQCSTRSMRAGAVTPATPPTLRPVAAIFSSAQ